MKVYFHTNLDKYQHAFFNMIDLPVIPRVGEYIKIQKSLQTHFQSNKLPTRLKVVSVTYNVHTELISEQSVIVELWYDQTDLEIMRMSNVEPF